MSHDRFRAIVEEETARARFFGRALSLVWLRFEPGGGRASPPAWVRSALRPVDRLARFSEFELEILLPEKPLDEALAWTRSLVERAPAGDRFAGSGVAVYPETAGCAEELLQAARDAAQGSGPAAPVRSASTIGRRTLGPRGTAASGSPLVVEIAGMQPVFDTAKRVARSTIPVLVLGETGTGKELVARAIHEAGPRKDRPLVAVNCGAIAGDLLLSTLFGHRKGAFSGAVDTTKGVFESANSGTVFLDEVGELSTQAQTALLRVLETKRVSRVGSTEEILLDVRIVAATHRDLEAMTKERTFREDLYYRLSAMMIRVPALRDRPWDVIPLSQHFLDEANHANGTSVRAFDPEAVRLLVTYPWPGNVRELRNAIERAVVIATSDTIGPEDLPDRIRVAPPSIPTPAALEDPETADDFESRLVDFERSVLMKALDASDGNQTVAARSINMPRRTFVEKMKKLGIQRKGYAASD
jgi:DNA-binding NtrC family response regulator